MSFGRYDGSVWYDRIGTMAGSGSNGAVGKSASFSAAHLDTTPGRAVDGNVSATWDGGSLAITPSSAQPWWQVDLGAKYDLHEVLIFNRTDWGMERLANYDVFLSDTPMTSADPAVVRQQPGVTAYPVAGPTAGVERIPVARRARYVRVQLRGTDYLQLAEVQAWGTAAPAASFEPEPPPESMASATEEAAEPARTLRASPTSIA